MIQAKNTISVNICSYIEQRWEGFLAAVASVREQTLQPNDIIAVVDHNSHFTEAVVLDVINAISIDTFFVD